MGSSSSTTKKGKKKSKKSKKIQVIVAKEEPEIFEELAEQVTTHVTTPRRPPRFITFIQDIGGTATDPQLASYWKVFEQWCAANKYNDQFEFAVAMKKLRAFCADSGKTKRQKQDEMKKMYDAWISPDSTHNINLDTPMKLIWTGENNYPFALTPPVIVYKMGDKFNYVGNDFLDKDGEIGPLIDPNSAGSMWRSNEYFVITAFDNSALTAFMLSPAYKKWITTPDGQGWQNPAELAISLATESEIGAKAHRGYDNEFVMDEYYTQSVSAPRQRISDGGYRSRELYGNDASVYTYGHSYAMDPMSILIIGLAMVMFVCCVIVVNVFCCVGGYALGRFQSEKSKGNRNDIEEVCVQND